MNTSERLRRAFEQLPSDKQEEVLDFVAYLSSRYRAPASEGVSLMGHAGRLKDSPNLNEDPVHIQRGLRDEW